MVEFVRYDANLHKSHLIDLNIRHLSWVAEELLTQYNVDIFSSMGISVTDYVKNSINIFEIYKPPSGIYYLLKLESGFIGMGALRKLTDNTGELKRMFIKQEHRGFGYGKSLLNELLRIGKEIGFTKLYLDTGLFMKAVQHIYESAGFRRREIYPETEVPPQMQKYWLFMEKIL